MKILAKILCIATSIAMAIPTIPLGLTMLPKHLHVVWVGSIVYFFGILPFIWLWAIDKEEKKKRAQDV